MSPRELYREMEAARGRARDEADARLDAAWHTARLTALALAGKLPALSEELKTTDANAQTKSGMLAMMHMLAGRNGQAVIRHKRES